MTLDADRRVGLPTVCPFVAFADERDLRAAEPDHRHRCYAEPQPSPRALAHQERYCLSPGFTSCPTFQDWAARAAANVADEAVPASAAASRLPGLFDESERAPVTAHADATFGEEETGDRGDQLEEPAVAGGSARRGRVAAWARPHRRETFPRLRRSGASVSPLVLGIVALGLAAGALFLLPSLITGLLGGGQSSPAASPTPTAAQTPGEPTPTAAPTPPVYVVRSGDTLSGIAKRFDVTLEELIAANPQITDPDKLAIGDVIAIPTPGPSPGASPVGSPAT